METVINEMAEPWIRAHKIREKLYGRDKTKANNPDLDNLLHYFLYPYAEAFNLLLEVLWERASKTTMSEIDSQFLHTRIVNLMTQLKFQGYPITERIGYLDFSVDELKSLPTTAKIYAKKNGISTKAQKIIISKIKDFEKQFLVKKLE